MLVRTWSDGNSHSLMVGVPNGATALKDRLVGSHKTKYSQTLVLEHLGSWTICFSTKLFKENMSRLFYKTSGHNSLPKNSFMFLPVWSVTSVSGDIQRKFGFRTNRFANSFTEWIKFKNWGSTIQWNAMQYNKYIINKLQHDRPRGKTKL